VEGNVICGGYEKVIYQADWHLLNTGDRPATLQPGDNIVDTLDVADLINEKEHRYQFPRPSAGFVQMRLLTYPAAPAKEVFDAGRTMTADRSERFTLRSPTRGASTRLIVRTAPVDTGTLDVDINGQRVGSIPIEPVDGWAELSVPIPATVVTGAPLDVTLTSRRVREWTHHHSWLVERP
jgi:hypothetical protein